MSNLQPPWDLVVLIIEIALFTYFLLINAFYALTTIVSILNLPKFVRLHRADPIVRLASVLNEPVSILCPAYNEDHTIVRTIKGLLAIDYDASEIIVINDGSSDATIETLTKEFALEPYPAAYRVIIPTAEILTIYQSRSDKRLRVIDKKNGGKADALNAGLNLSRFPLVLSADADTYYHPSALRWMAESFQKDPRTVVVGGTIGIGNDCMPDSPEKTFSPKLPRKMILRFQALEYLRAFLATRMGLAPINGLGIISGACGLWRKSVIIEAGGYRTDTVWEDMEMTLRAHHMLKRKRRSYRVAFTPFPVAWTHAPDTMGTLFHQRKLWHRHLSECVSIHRRLLWHGGVLGWITMPYLTFFEWLAPIIVSFGILFGIAGIYFHFLDWFSQIILFSLVLVLATLNTIITILLDEISYAEYQLRDIWGLFWAAIIENFGYRQFTAIANLAGFFVWCFGLRYRGRKHPGPFIKAYDPLAKHA